MGAPAKGAVRGKGIAGGRYCGGRVLRRKGIAGGEARLLLLRAARGLQGRM